ENRPWFKRSLLFPALSLPNCHSLPEHRVPLSAYSPASQPTGPCTQRKHLRRLQQRADTAKSERCGKGRRGFVSKLPRLFITPGSASAVGFVAEEAAISSTSRGARHIRACRRTSNLIY